MIRKTLILAFAVTATLFAKAQNTCEDLDFAKYVKVSVAEKPELQMAAMTLGSITGNPLVGGFLGAQALQFNPEKAGFVVDSTLKSGALMRVKVMPEFFDKLFEKSENSADYVGSIGETEVVYSVTKLGLEAKGTIKVGGEVLAKINEMKTFKLAQVNTIDENALAFSQGGVECSKTITIDVKNEIEKLKALSEKKDEVDWQKKAEDFSKKFMEKYNGANLALAFKGFKPSMNAKNRFAATLPEYMEEDVLAVSFVSIYSLVKTLAPAVISAIEDPDMKTTASMILMQLPAEGKAGIGGAVKRVSDDTLAVHYRISADEIKAISGAANTVFMMAMMNGGFGGADETDGDIDDEDLEIED